MQRIDSLTDVPELSDLFVPRSTNFHNFKKPCNIQWFEAKL